VIPLLGGTVTSASRHFSHYLNLVVNIAMLTFVLGFVWNQSKRRDKQPTRWLKYGPTYLVAIASLLILADPMRHILQDLHLWRAPMYISGCPVRALQIPERTCIANSDCGGNNCGGGYFSVNPGEDCFTCWHDTGFCSEGAEAFRCLSVYGWMLTVVATYAGFALFFFAVLWNANITGKLKKIRRQWRALRRM
jgi:hypothetical protein